MDCLQQSYRLADCLDLVGESLTQIVGDGRIRLPKVPKLRLRFFENVQCFVDHHQLASASVEAVKERPRLADTAILSEVVQRKLVGPMGDDHYRREAQ